MGTDDRQRLGRRGEELAAQHLVAKGCIVVAQNWRCPAGELDLVVRQGDCLAFVEVRTRRGRAYGTPEESVTQAKKARLVALAETYLQENDWHGRYRIDLVAIEMDRRGQLLRLEHYENAVAG